jgi:hypothetical protein
MPIISIVDFSPSQRPRYEAAAAEGKRLPRSSPMRRKIGPFTPLSCVGWVLFSFQI